MCPFVRYLIVSDQNGSPLAVFDTDGNVVKEITRTPFGGFRKDTHPDFYIPIDFHGGILDPHTRLVYLDKKWYDPSVGQWITPDWERLSSRLSYPTDIFIYRFQNNDPIGSSTAQNINYMTGTVSTHYLYDFVFYKSRVCVVTDLNSWLKLYGYDISKMIGSTYTRTQLHQPSAKVSSPQLTPQFNVVSGLQCIVEKVISYARI